MAKKKVKKRAPRKVSKKKVHKKKAKIGLIAAFSGDVFTDRNNLEKSLLSKVAELNHQKNLKPKNTALINHLKKEVSSLKRQINKFTYLIKKYYR